jgi:hypothetical protein
MDNNRNVLESKKKSFIQILKELFKGADASVYEVKYIDHTRNAPVYERVNFVSFREDLDKKIRTLASLSSHGPSAGKLDGMQEDQLHTLLERNMREIQGQYKILSALDEFFKTSVDQKDRGRIKGIKAELESIKSAISRANAKRHEYEDKKEEEQKQQKKPAAAAP